MNILYVGAFRLPNYDAAAARVLNIARAMHMSDHNIKFISWGGKYRERDLCDDGKYRIDGMEYIITNEIDVKCGPFCKIKSRLRRGNKTMSIIMAFQEKTDIIIMYNASGKLSKRLLDYTLKNRIYLVNDITEWYSNRELPFTSILSNWYNMTYLQKRIRNKILISSFLDKYYSGSHNIVIPATCDILEPKWEANDGDNRTVQINPFSGITFIYAGNPARKDCLHTVINAVQRLITEGAAIRFIILGIARDIFISQYVKVLHTCALSERIIFVGRVPQDIVPVYYRLADFMVLIRENNRKSNAGFPTKFAESMISGIPVIANITGDLGMYLIPGHNGIVVRDSSYDELYQIIRTNILPLSRVEINRMKQNAKKIGLEKFNYRQYCTCLNDFIENLD